MKNSASSPSDVSNRQRTRARDLAIGLGLAISFIAGLGAAKAEAVRRAPPKYYEQPSGFAGHQWGDSFASFQRLGTAISVEAAWDDGKRLDDHFQCSYLSDGTCDIDAVVRWANMQRRRSALTLVSQHQIEAQGFRVAGVMMHPVTHFFCGQWRELLEKAPPDLQERMGYCGIRLEFEGENREALESLPADHVTQYQELLRHLILKHGKPYGYRGHVSVYDDNDAKRAARREFPPRYRWCTQFDSIFAPKCDVKMTLSFDAETGKGSLLMAAPALVQFALARRSEDGRTHSPLYYELIRDPRRSEQ